MENLFKDWKGWLCCIGLFLLVYYCNGNSGDELNKTVLSNAIIQQVRGAYRNVEILSVKKSEVNDLKYDIEFEYDDSSGRKHRSARVFLFQSGVIDRIWLNDDIRAVH